MGLGMGGSTWRALQALQVRGNYNSQVNQLSPHAELTNAPQNSCSPEPQNVTLFENGIFADVTS